MGGSEYKKNSLSLAGAVSLGTGVMIGAAVFALLGQMAELSGAVFPFIFLTGGIVAGICSYSYMRVSSANPSAGGIAMILKMAYGETALTAGSALLMAFAMIINQSLVARTFGSYTMQLFDEGNRTPWIPVLGVGLLIIVFIINILGNQAVERSALVMAILKVGGLIVFSVGGLWAAGFSLEKAVPDSFITEDYSLAGYLGATALAVLAFAGFTTITNSGAEIVKPRKNVARAIVISLVICIAIYLIVAFAVSANLSVAKIIEAKDFSLAEAARPTFGGYGLWFTIGIAILATFSGVMANIFAVSRMTAMLTEMKLIPHSHFGMPGRIQQHMLVYTTVIAIFLTIFFDLTRIASLGAIFYIVMDIIVHFGLLTRLRGKVEANAAIVLSALVLDVIILGGFVWIKTSRDPFVVALSFGLMILIFAGEWFFLRKRD